MMGQLRNFRFWRCVLAEFLGSLFVVLFTCGSQVMIRDTYTGSEQCQFHQTRVLMDFVHSCVAGFVITSMTWTLRDVSGGHLNPAVSAAMLITRKVTFQRCVMYFMAQCSGAISGSAILHSLTASRHAGLTSLAGHVYTAQGFGVEFCLTFLYVFTYFASVDRKRSEVPGPSLVAFGASYIASSTFGLSYTGASMNPARSLGPAVLTNTWDRHWIYWTGPLLGGIVGGFMYDIMMSPNASSQRTLAFLCDQEYDGDSFDCPTEDYIDQDLYTKRSILWDDKVQISRQHDNVRTMMAFPDRYDTMRDRSNSMELQSIISEDRLHDLEPHDRMTHV